MAKPLLTNFLYRQRLKMVVPFLKGSVLDLGCGLGGLRLCLKNGQSYLGVDDDDHLVEFLKAEYPGIRFRCLNLDTDALEFGEKFDSIVLLAVLEHLEQPDHLFAQLGKCLQPGGTVVLTTPTPAGNFIHANGARVGLFSKEAAADHFLIYDRQKLNRLGAAHGFTVIEYRRFQLGGNQLCVFARASENAQGITHL